MYLETGEEVSDSDGGKKPKVSGMKLLGPQRLPSFAEVALRSTALCRGVSGLSGFLSASFDDLVLPSPPSIAQIAPATIIIGTVAVAIIAVAGTAFALSKESIPGVIAVWVGLFVPVAYAVVKFGGEGEDPPQ